MYDTWHDKEFLHGIISAIHEHAATVRDEHMFWVGVAGVVVSLIAVIATACILSRQIRLMKQQSITMLKQAKISQKQSEIMEQQSKIALFKEKYELYMSVVSVHSACKTISEDFDLFLSNLSNDGRKYSNSLDGMESLYLFSSMLVYKGDISDYTDLISNGEKFAKKIASKETINFVKNFNKIFFLYNLSQNDIDEIANMLLKIKHINEELQKNTRCNMLVEIKEISKLISESKFYPNMSNELKIKY